jgi:hypothetical protein
MEPRKALEGMAKHCWLTWFRLFSRAYLLLLQYVDIIMVKLDHSAVVIQMGRISDAILSSE